jgi:plastocyanin
MSQFRNRFFILIIALAFCCTACTRNSTPAESPTTSNAPKLPPIDPATTASISGVVKFDGTAPAPEKIDMSADPACQGDNSWQPIIVNQGHLANVLVYVKDGLNGHTFDPPPAVYTIAQKNCAYVPHVAAVMAGQPVEFLDEDPTMHNIHPQPRNNKEWNQSQQANGGKITRTFQNPELMIPIKCNQHPWMKMYLSVFNHPYFAVTGPDGSFTLQGLPPGTYTVAAVQEKLGEKTQTITVGPKEEKTRVAFAY